MIINNTGKKEFLDENFKICNVSHPSQQKRKCSAIFILFIFVLIKSCKSDRLKSSDFPVVKMEIHDFLDATGTIFSSGKLRLER